MTWDAEVDAAGLLCPLPVLKARKRLLRMHPGQVLRLVATDAMAVVDIPHFCTEAGHHLLSDEDTPAGHVWLIRRGP
jgi:tRNA 2-thiouridine synthesizing protein A